MMPDMNGIDVWKNMPPALREAMIFVTGGTFTERANAFFAEVKPPMMEKPLNVSDLEKAIARRLQGQPALQPR
jgi:DNA-binding LytR/AlgR family response regulator